MKYGVWPLPKPNLWKVPPLLKKNKYGRPELYRDQIFSHTINFYNKKFSWLLIVDRIWLMWHTYISHSHTPSLPYPPPSLFLSPWVWSGTFVTFAFFCNNLSIFSGAPAVRRAAKRSPRLIMRKKREPLGGFSHGYHARGRVRTTTEATATESRNMVAKHQIYETCSLGLPYTSLQRRSQGLFPCQGKVPGNEIDLFDIGYLCHAQLTPVNSRYLLTIITWPYHRLKLGTHRGHVFFGSWPLTKCWSF